MLTLPITRTITVEVIPFEGKNYVRTREIANLLEIKQPFEFASDIKKYNNTFILSEEDTEHIRTSTDRKNVTFIELDNLLEYLDTNTRLNHRANNILKDQLIMYLKKVKEVGKLL